MSITFQLANPWPGLNQLNEAIHDGLPDGDRSYECVPTSIASGLIFLTGRVYDGDGVRDAVYGANYVGGTAPSAYVAYCRAQGVDLAPFNGSQSALVAHLHSELHAGHPVVVTMPSNWGTPPPDPVHPVGWTHVGLMYGDGPGMLRCMNPWIWPSLHDGDDAYWAARLCFGQVWVMSKIVEAPQPVSIILETNAAGNITGAHDASNPNLHIGAGFALAAKQQNLLGTDITLPETAISIPASLGSVGDVQACVLSHRYVGTWQHATGVTRVEDWYEVSQALEAQHLAAASVPGLQQQLTAAQAAGQQAIAQAQAAQAAEATAQQAEAVAQADVTKLTGQVNAATQQLADADAQIAALKAQLLHLPPNPPVLPPASAQDTAIAQAAEAMVSAVEAALNAAKAGNAGS